MKAADMLFIVKELKQFNKFNLQFTEIYFNLYQSM